MAQDPVNTFFARLDGTGRLWRSLDVRAVAIRVEGSWRSLATVVRLSTASRDALPVAQHVPRIPALRFVQVRLHYSRLRDLLQGYANGHDRLGRFRIFYDDQATSTRSARFSFSFGERDSGWSPVRGWGAYVLTGSGESLGHTLARAEMPSDEIENELRLGDHPFDGFTDLAEHLLGASEYLNRSYSERFEVIAPLEGRLVPRDCYLHDGLCQVSLEAGSEAVARRLDLGFSALGTKRASGRVVIAEEAWRPSGGPGMWQATVRWPAPRAKSVKVMLRLGPQCIDRVAFEELRVPDNNMRLAAYRTIDLDGRELKGTLFPSVNSSAAKEFEHAVARLFVLLGFQVDSYAGQRKLGQGADALAYDPFSASALVLECTTGSLDSQGKLGKLVARTEALRERVPGRRWIPVLVTSLEKGTPAELNKAATDGVTVVTRRVLKYLYEQLPSDPPTTDVLRVLEDESLGVLRRVMALRQSGATV